MAESIQAPAGPPAAGTDAPLTREQIRRYVRTHYPFGLPAGSVRALLALVTFGGI